MELITTCRRIVLILLVIFVSSYETAPSELIGEEACGAKPAEIYFLLDSSTSIWSVDFKKQLEFVETVVKTFDIGPDKTRIGVASFSYSFHEHFGLDKYSSKNEIAEAVKRIPQYIGGTNTYRALRGVLSNGLSKEKVRKDIARILIVLTDGASSDAKRTKEAAKIVKDEGIVVFAVGIGSNTNKEELAAIASTPKSPEDKYLFEVENFNELDDTVKHKLTTKACEVEIEEEKSEEVESVEVDQKDDNAGPECGRNNIADVMFVVDPAEVGSKDTKRIYDFIGNVVKDFNMGKNNIQVGLESQNCGAANISLNQYNNSRDLAKAFRSTQVSIFPDMLKRLRTHSFTKENGGRRIARKMAVVFVDDSLYDKKTVLDEARRTKLQDIELFIVAIGDSVIDDELKALSTSPVERHIIRVPSYQHLMESKPQFMKKFCHGL